MIHKYFLGPDSIPAGRDRARRSEQYHKMRRLGVFVNAPDVYFQQGSNKMVRL